MVWVYEFEDYIDTQYVSIKNDSILFYDHMDPLLVGNYYIFPFEVGSGWGSSIDTSYVIEQTTIITEAGEFVNSYRIKRQNNGYNYFLDADMWFVNKIGIVAIEKVEINLGPFVYSKWELLDYDTGQ